ncbi:BolA family protein [Oceanisphaera avium]|uniref:Cell division protein BolA n=1 Tax=Oceanisphaera avium TaxID=1903694 RepID=A0A1Y0CZR2_9GAMM|nr:BolA/IbaG family iron-sulfur metabolism protein [Oceanisphaera avium]ART80821.1 cell division protein BolA [Oceanisphaera avium]
MSLNEQVEQLVRSAIAVDEIYVKSEGTHVQVIAVAPEFNELSRLKREQAIKRPLAELIADNTIHALTVKTFTPEQWARERKFIMPS